MNNETATAIASLTANGKAFMTLVGQRHFDFFDGGIVEGEGNWGSCLSDQLAYGTGKSVKSSSGIMSATKKAGLWLNEEQDGDTWWALTALGADVANALAKEAEETVVGEAEETVVEEAPAPVLKDAVDVKVGRVWTDLFDENGVKIAGVRTEDIDRVIAALQMAR